MTCDIPGCRELATTVWDPIYTREQARAHVEYDTTPAVRCSLHYISVVFWGAADLWTVNPWRDWV